MEIKTVVVGSLQTNCYIIADDETKDAAIIDPGDEAGKILKEIKKGGYQVRQIIITHNHPDHVGALEEIRKKTDAKICMGEKEFNYNFLKIDEKLKDGQVCKIGRIKYKIMHTSGHSPGSICLIFENEKKIFSGDILFHRGVGRTDLPGGSMEQMDASIERLLALPDDYKVYPGHGPATTIGQEK